MEVVCPKIEAAQNDSPIPERKTSFDCLRCELYPRNLGLPHEPASDLLLFHCSGPFRLELTSESVASFIKGAERFTSSVTD